MGAGDADEAAEVGFGHAQELGFLAAHDVGPVGQGLGDAGQDADVAGRIDPDGALVQGIEQRRCLEIRRFGPALPRARHAAIRTGAPAGAPSRGGDRTPRKAVGGGGGTMQHAFAAAAFRQRLAVGRHQPAAKAAGAPVDDDEGCGRAMGRTFTGASVLVVDHAWGRRPARPGLRQGRASPRAHRKRRWRRRREERNPTSRRRSACR